MRGLRSNALRHLDPPVLQVLEDQLRREPLRRGQHAVKAAAQGDLESQAHFVATVAAQHTVGLPAGASTAPLSG